MFSSRPRLCVDAIPPIAPAEEALRDVVPLDDVELEVDELALATPPLTASTLGDAVLFALAELGPAPSTALGDGAVCFFSPSLAWR